MLLNLLEYSYSSISDFLNSRYVKSVRFGVVYVNLWSDEFTIKSSIDNTYNNKCLHKVVHQETNRCLKCKAFVGHISEEEFDIDYYNNIYWMKSKLKAEEIYIRTDRYYPDNFTPNLYGSTLALALKAKAMYSKTYVISDGKVKPFSYRNIKSGKKIETYYLIHFTKKKKNLFKDNHYLAKLIKPQNLIRKSVVDNRTLIINPYYNEVVVAENVLNIISNSKINKYISSKRF